MKDIDRAFFISEYDDVSVCVGGFYPGASAAVEREEDCHIPCACVVTSVLSRAECSCQCDYETKADYIKEHSSSYATAEFITDDDIYYVELDRIA